ncbi:MAG: hypothetical protein CMP67_04415 [Flavobacteriales bacterium]|nr:hypothetical protein [Flavobacteriales bacterium]|tara:strand:- start:57353 stop:58618 length:1266 start_codon:yes stop_codon:yes gene_type:complete
MFKKGENKGSGLDTILNIGSFGVNAVVGLLLNFLIVEFYSSESLGVFNISYAIYIFLSQAGVFGIHNSVLKYASDFSKNTKELKQVLSSSLSLASIWALLMLVIAFVLSDVFMTFYDTKSAILSFQIVVVGVFFFILNKIQLSFINGLSKLKTYAFFLALRGVLMLSVFFGLVFYDFDPVYLSAVFSFSEIILFLLLSIFLFNFFQFSSFWNLNWLKKHFQFGRHSFVGSFLMDVGSKTDILVLGLFVSDYLVGMYSFVAFFMEGFNQIPIVIRSVTNPKINKLYRTGRSSLLESFLKLVIKKSYLGFIPFGVVCVLCFPLVIYFSPKFDLWNSWILIALLMLGPILESGYSSVQMIYNQCGFPKIQSLFSAIVFLWNLAFNFLLIPFLGIYGAAIATTSSFILKIFLMKYYAKSKIGVSI